MLISENIASRGFLARRFIPVVFDEVTKQVVIMARKGLLLPYCPECGMFLDLDTEALAGKCDTCGARFLIENIPWLKRDVLPKA